MAGCLRDAIRESNPAFVAVFAVTPVVAVILALLGVLPWAIPLSAVGALVGTCGAIRRNRLARAS